MQENNDAETPGASTSFEEVFSRLEQIVRELETGQMNLDQSTSLFEEGMRLAKKCNEMLSAAELKITRLQKDFAEQLDMVPDQDL